MHRLRLNIVLKCSESHLEQTCTWGKQVNLAIRYENRSGISHSLFLLHLRSTLNVNNVDVSKQRELHTNGLTEAEQLHGPKPQSKSGLGQSWNEMEEFSSSLWWVPEKCFVWLYGENKW